MDRYFIALEFENKLTNSINKQKKLVMDKVGEQEYLSEPPHVTLFPFTFRGVDKIYSQLEQIAENTHNLSIRLKELHVFYDDVRAPGNTITYLFPDEDNAKLKYMQSQIIQLTEEFNTKEFFSKDIYETMSQTEKENTDKYGFPFVGKNWRPHITVSHVKKEHFKQIWRELNKNPITGEFLIDSINLYSVTEKLTLIKKFYLKND